MTTPRARRTPQRYQLNKHALAAIDRNHPWVFRDQLSSAATALTDGQWLALYDGSNKIVGYGIYEAEGAIGVRVITRGAARPDALHFRSVIDRALSTREALRRETNAFRAIQGESDGLPAVVVDVFADTVVVQTYSAGTEALGRFAAAYVAKLVGAKHIVSKPARRRVGATGELVPRVLRGAPPEEVPFREGALDLVARPKTGQKSGTFLDLRGLRRRLATMPLTGKRVLNLFAYTGTAGRAAEAAGAAEIWQVDRSVAALELGEESHAADPSKHTWIAADIFEWLPALDPKEQFDLVIVDPPSMTSRIAQVPDVLATFGRLYKQAARHVAPGGTLVACDCTSRVARATFRSTVGGVLGKAFALDDELPPEPDHPAAFPEADYLKILFFHRRGPKPTDPTRSS
ncbi:MAG TPA: class I SAM-dependent methyltransferase [Kofleriaceae bacterium]|jgi:23S rRNA (cytosine1962-C5)-methyltransferase|nr:class I SAM-dependent methyltransferase [Kofleriaceae bacterium]